MQDSVDSVGVSVHVFFPMLVSAHVSCTFLMDIVSVSCDRVMA